MPTLELAFPILSILICIGLIVATLNIRQLRGRLMQLLLGWFFALILWNVSLAWLPEQQSLVAQWLAALTTVIIGILFWAVVQYGHKLPDLRHWILSRLALAIGLIGLAALANWLGMGVCSSPRIWLVQAVATTIGTVFSVSGLVTAAQVAGQPRDRLFVYGLVAFASLSLGMIGVLGICPLLDISAPLWGALSALMTVLFVLRAHSVEPRSLFRNLLIYVLVTLATGLILVSNLYILQQAFAGLAFGLSLIIVIGTVGGIYTLMHRLISSAVDRLLFGKTVDWNHYLQTFNKRAADILDLEQLADAMMQIIGEALDVHKGVLLVGDNEEQLDNITFRVIGHSDQTAVEPLKFRAFSPLMDDLRRRGICVTRDMLERDPRYAVVREQERAWLGALGMYLFVPIRSRGELIGILALGEKARKFYRDDEIEFLIELADRSAFLVQNARLFSEMRTLNSVLNRLYTDLDVVNRRLQEMDKLKSAFIGVITHELRSPLAGMDFSLQLLQRQLGDRLDVEQAATIHDLVKGFEQLKFMIDKLVNFAAFLSKQGELHKTQVNMAQLIQEAVSPLSTMAQMRQIDLKVQVQEDLPPVWVDRERIAEAIHHLVHNALKFTPPQGHVSVSCAADEHLVNVRVTDTGVGVSPEMLKTIWDGFSQSADPLRRGVEGLGVGLALVKYIVTAHGGEVWAFSRLGQGSTFGFRIPISKPSELEHKDFSLVSDEKVVWGQ